MGMDGQYWHSTPSNSIGKLHQSSVGNREKVLVQTYCDSGVQLSVPSRSMFGAYPILDAQVLRHAVLMTRLT